MRIAVVGAGISGLYCAWRLSESGKDVTVFESGDDVGGRIDTQFERGVEPAELGAMRFVASHHLLLELLEKLGLEKKPFPQSEPRALFLRGQLIPCELLSARWSGSWRGHLDLPYRLRDELRGAGPIAVLLFLLVKILPPGTKIPEVFTDARAFETLLAEASFERRPFFEYGLWNLAEYVLTTEEFAFLRDTIGIESAVGNWNAHRALVLLASLLRGLAGPEGLLTIEGGMERVVRAFERGLRAGGRKIHLRSRVRAVSVENGRSQLDIDSTQMIGPQTFDQVILAIPPAAMRDMTFKPNGLSSKLETARAWIRPVEATRIYLRYKTAWWKDVGFGVTTLPLRQIYYWSGGQGRDEPGLLMASYTDAAASEFWEDASARPIDHRIGAGGPRPVFTKATDDSWLVKQVQKMLAEMHPGAGTLPEPTHASVIAWSGRSFSGGAWHAWRPRVDASVAMREIRQPWEGVYVVGEAWSDLQGWVEGALSSSEHVLTDHFGIPPLLAGCYLGP